jgi:hypothetical protein
MCVSNGAHYTECGCKHSQKGKMARCGPWLSEQVREKARQLMERTQPKTWWRGVKASASKPKYEPCVVQGGDEAIEGFCPKCTAQGPEFMKMKAEEWSWRKIELNHANALSKDYIHASQFANKLGSSQESDMDLEGQAARQGRNHSPVGLGISMQIVPIKERVQIPQLSRIRVLNDHNDQQERQISPHARPSKHSPEHRRPASAPNTQKPLPPPEPPFNSSLRRMDHTRRRIAPVADMQWDGGWRNPAPPLSGMPAAYYKTRLPPGGPLPASRIPQRPPTQPKDSTVSHVHGPESKPGHGAKHRHLAPKYRLFPRHFSSPFYPLAVGDGVGRAKGWDTEHLPHALSEIEEERRIDLLRPVHERGERHRDR